MASIAGVSFGTSLCNHLVRRFVTMRFDIGPGALFGDGAFGDGEFGGAPSIGYYVDLPAPVDLSNSSIVLYVNNEVFQVGGGIIYPERPTRVVFGFMLGGYGFGQFGQGGFNTTVNIADFGQYPVDDIELQFKALPNFCPKCVLVDDNTGNPIVAL